MPITTVYISDPFLVITAYLLGFASCWVILFFIALKNTQNRRNKPRKHKRQ